MPTAHNKVRPFMRMAASIRFDTLITRYHIIDWTSNGRETIRIFHLTVAIFIYENIRIKTDRYNVWIKVCSRQ